QRVVAPAVPATNPSWVVILSNLSPGSSIEVHLFGSGTSAGTANVVRLWMTAAGALACDSVTAATAAGTKFAAELAARRLSRQLATPAPAGRLGRCRRALSPSLR